MDKYVDINQISNFINFLEQINEVSVTLRIVLAIVCGGLIGAERQKAHQPAGLRTYMLVCMGAAMVMITGQYMYCHFDAGDPARLGAQVVSGIGFLGAGSIIVSRDTKVRGLTTAAGLWASACIGLAIGTGYYSAGIIATLAVYIIMSRLRVLGNVHGGNNMVGVYIEFDGNVQISEIIYNIKSYGLDIHEIKIDNTKLGIKKVTLAFHMEAKYDKIEFTTKINKLDGIRYVEFLF